MEKIMKSELGAKEKLIAVMSELTLTPSQVAELIGCSRGTIYRILSKNDAISSYIVNSIGYFYDKHIVKNEPFDKKKLASCKTKKPLK
jgi:predicted transcriptional regulator